MTLGKILLDLFLGLVVISLACAVLISLAWIALPVYAMVSSRRETNRPLRGAEALTGWYAEPELAEIDQALEAILKREQPRTLIQRG